MPLPLYSSYYNNSNVDRNLNSDLYQHRYTLNQILNEHQMTFILQFYLVDDFHYTIYQTINRIFLELNSIFSAVSEPGIP